jgi:hypothetical protein
MHIICNYMLHVPNNNQCNTCAKASNAQRCTLESRLNEQYNRYHNITVLLILKSFYHISVVNPEFPPCQSSNQMHHILVVVCCN